MFRCIPTAGRGVVHGFQFVFFLAEVRRWGLGYRATQSSIMRSMPQKTSWFLHSYNIVACAMIEGPPVNQKWFQPQKGAERLS